MVRGISSRVLISHQTSLFHKVMIHYTPTERTHFGYKPPPSSQLRTFYASLWCLLSSTYHSPPLFVMTPLPCLDAYNIVNTCQHHSLVLKIQILGSCTVLRCNVCSIFVPGTPVFPFDVLHVGWARDQPWFKEFSLRDLDFLHVRERLTPDSIFYRDQP